MAKLEALEQYYEGNLFKSPTGGWGAHVESDVWAQDGATGLDPTHAQKHDSVGHGGEGDSTHEAQDKFMYRLRTGASVFVSGTMLGCTRSWPFRMVCVIGAVPLTWSDLWTGLPRRDRSTDVHYGWCQSTAGGNRGAKDGQTFGAA